MWDEEEVDEEERSSTKRRGRDIVKSNQEWYSSPCRWLRLRSREVSGVVDSLFASQGPSSQLASKTGAGTERASEPSEMAERRGGDRRTNEWNLLLRRRGVRGGR